MKILVTSSPGWLLWKDDKGDFIDMVQKSPWRNLEGTELWEVDRLWKLDRLWEQETVAFIRCIN